MAGDPFAINDKADLTNVVRTDRIPISRANKIYRVDLQEMPNRLSPRRALVAPVLSDFSTWVNQGTGQLIQISDGVRIFGDRYTTTGANPMMRVRTMPGGSWDIVLGCVRGFTFINFLNGGMVLRESATGKLTVNGFGVPNSDRFHVQYYTAPTTFGGNLTTAQEKNSNIGWFRARKVSTNIEYLYSPDGRVWAQYYVEAITAHFTTAPDQWGYFIEVNNSGLSVAGSMDVIDWSE
jgi:hypothetical protein